MGRFVGARRAGADRGARQAGETARTAPDAARSAAGRLDSVFGADGRDRGNDRTRPVLRRTGETVAFAVFAAFRAAPSALADRDRSRGQTGHRPWRTGTVARADDGTRCAAQCGLQVVGIADRSG